MTKNVRKNIGLHRWTGFDVAIMAVAIFAVVITVYPMIYVLSSSFSDPIMVQAGKVVLLPVGFSTKAYEIICKDTRFWRSFFNSVGYVVANCLLMLFTTVTVAYPLTRPNLRFRKILNYYLLIPMYFSGGMIPSFILITRLGLYNSPLSLILPSCFSIWNIILCRTYMASLPGELIESALIDGSDQVKTLIHIVLPLAKPVLAVIMIYTIVGVWNSWFSASIYTTNVDIQPLQLYLRNKLATTSSSMKDFMEGLPMEELERYQDIKLAATQIKYAMIVLSTFPIIAVYPLFQKHFTKGIMLGSLKG